MWDAVIVKLPQYELLCSSLSGFGLLGNFGYFKFLLLHGQVMCLIGNRHCSINFIELYCNRSSN